MNANASRSNRLGTALSAAIVVAALGLGLTYERWIPLFHEESNSLDAHDHDAMDHASHDHNHDHDHKSPQHDGHDDASAIELSAAAWKNVGLRTQIVMPQSFVRTISVPALVTERPGRSQVQLTAPFTGIVTNISLIEGEVVLPGEPLFTLRLTHEDLVTAQRAFLQSTQELEIVQNEIKRLLSVGDGVIAGKKVVEQEYEKQKIEAIVLAQRQGLLLHGLDNAQIDEIIKTRTLLQSLTVTAPQFVDDGIHHELDHVYHVQQINVQRGQHVAAGDTLGVLADHCMLYVEGQAFEDDAERLTQAAREGWEVAVSQVAAEGPHPVAKKLRIFYVADHIDSDSRALKFYLNLPNSLVRDQRRDSHRFVAWKYRPGQRMEVRIPISEPLQNQIVLPIDAVIEDGAEWFVFQQNGDHFDRKSVHLVYRDRDTAVVENDGKLSGTTLAMSGAFQMNLALKNQAGEGVDPHAGHSH